MKVSANLARSVWLDHGAVDPLGTMMLVLDRIYLYPMAVQSSLRDRYSMVNVEVFYPAQEQSLQTAGQLHGESFNGRGTWSRVLLGVKVGRITVARSWSHDGCAVIGLVRVNLGMMEVAVVSEEFLWLVGLALVAMVMGLTSLPEESDCQQMV